MLLSLASPAVSVLPEHWLAASEAREKEGYLLLQVRNPRPEKEAGVLRVWCSVVQVPPSKGLRPREYLRVVSESGILEASVISLSRAPGILAA